MSRYDADDLYCLPGTALLKNKAGITDQALLDQYEADFTAVRLLELAQNPIQGAFDLAHLCKIMNIFFRISMTGLEKSGVSISFAAIAVSVISDRFKHTLIPFFHASK